MIWQVYILYSQKLNRYYTGCTRQLQNRVENHLSHFYGSESFTAKADDWIIKLLLNCKDEQHAKAVELHIKRMKSSTYIQNLIKYPEMQQKLLANH